MEQSVSLIIPAWNEEKIILKTFHFLKKLKLPFKYSEIILIAGGVDNTFQICEEVIIENFNHKFALKQEPKDFKFGAIIKGLKMSKGDIITILDADTIPAPNFMIEVVKALKKYDVVNCDYVPMLQKSFWYDYFIINKLIWAKNPDKLPSLFGAATISLKRGILNRIGIENFFTDKTTAGVDHYMGIVLKKNHINIGFVKNTYVITPRPGSFRDFIIDQSRWFNAFFKIHEKDKHIITSTLFISILSIIFPITSMLIIFYKLRNIRIKFAKKIKFIFIILTIEYILNLLRIKAIFERITKRLKFLGHFKGSRY